MDIRLLVAAHDTATESGMENIRVIAPIELADDEVFMEAAEKLGFTVVVSPAAHPGVLYLRDNG